MNWLKKYAMESVVSTDQQEIRNSIASNYRTVLDNIRRAAEGKGRDPSKVRLLAASKLQDEQKIRAAIAAGIHLFGENYVQEAKAKIEAVEEPVEWHMIGHLQKNKARQAARLFSLIESLDRLELAVELDREGEKQGSPVRVFVEVNLAKEESKGGVDEQDVPLLLQQVGELSHLRVEGLMIIPPMRQDPEEVRPYFRRLRELQASLGELGIPNVELKELSMGMTHDYLVAVEEGATIVRVGTAIFEARKG